MKYIFLILFLMSSNCFAFEDIKNIEYVRNYDGDTITVNIPTYPDIIGKNISVRIIGIDSPEIHGKCELEKEQAIYLREFVKKQLSNAKNIKITNPKRDKYFRILGDIVYDGKSLKDELLATEFVFSYDGGKKFNYWCK